MRSGSRRPPRPRWSRRVSPAPSTAGPSELLARPICRIRSGSQPSRPRSGWGSRPVTAMLFSAAEYASGLGAMSFQSASIRGLPLAALGRQIAMSRRAIPHRGRASQGGATSNPRSVRRRRTPPRALGERRRRQQATRTPARETASRPARRRPCATAWTALRHPGSSQGPRRAAGAPHRIAPSPSSPMIWRR
jgi:hypothetical protein